MKKELGVECGLRRSILDVTTGELVERDHEFAHMSLKPGIGAAWFEKFSSDVFPGDYVVVNGRKAKPPRYYDKKFSRMDPETFALIQADRDRDGRSRFADNSEERLQVKERVARARVNLKKRYL
jgi:hypothetical protein